MGNSSDKTSSYQAIPNDDIDLELAENKNEKKKKNKELEHTMYEKFDKLSLTNNIKVKNAAEYFDKSIYIGEMKDTHRNGIGKYFNRQECSIYAGEWVCNFLVKGTIYFKDGSSIEGTFEFKKSEGFMKHTSSNGIITQCNYVKDKKQGHASIEYPNGDILLCQFTNDKKFGAALYKTDNVWFDQYYINDALIYQHKKYNADIPHIKVD